MKRLLCETIFHDCISTLVFYFFEELRNSSLKSGNLSQILSPEIDVGADSMRISVSIVIFVCKEEIQDSFVIFDLILFCVIANGLRDRKRHKKRKTQ